MPGGGPSDPVDELSMASSAASGLRQSGRGCLVADAGERLGDGVLDERVAPANSSMAISVKRRGGLTRLSRAAASTSATRFRRSVATPMRRSACRSRGPRCVYSPGNDPAVEFGSLPARDARQVEQGGGDLELEDLVVVEAVVVEVGPGRSPSAALVALEDRACPSMASLVQRPSWPS